MAKKQKKEKEEKQEPVQEVEAEAEQKQKPKVPKEGNPFLTILTILLVLVGVGELALWGYYGFGIFQNTRAMRQYEAEQQALAEERASRGAAVGGSFGPNLKVENGVVTWQREDDLPAGGSALSSGGSALSVGSTGLSQGGDKWLFRFSVPEIPYLLAEADTEDASQSPAQSQTEGAAADGTAPTAT